MIMVNGMDGWLYDEKCEEEKEKKRVLKWS